MSGRAPWWTRDEHARRRPFLLQRSRVTGRIRPWFAAEGFCEIDPAALQVSPGNEAHLHAFASEAISPALGRQPLYLHTSPEFAMKKLLAAGEERIFSLGHVFRNRERGPLHHPEFTMLEWYRAGETYDRLMQDTSELVRLAAETTGRAVARYRGRSCDLTLGPERVSVADAFRELAGIDILATVGEGETDRAALVAACRDTGIRIAEDDTWSDMFSRVLVEKIEPCLGKGRPTLLDRYPVAEAALARRSNDDPRVAERFELYACGVELANGFGELTEPAEQRWRFVSAMDEKARVYGERYPLDEDFLSALDQMPPASGVALGLDRLVMLATGAERIDDVIWTPVAEPDIART